MDVASEAPKKNRRMTPTRFFLRGLAISLPPILTLVILIWIGRGIHTYIIFPASSTVRFVIAQFIDDSIPTNSTSPQLIRLANGPSLEYVGENYFVTNELGQDYNNMVLASRTQAGAGEIEEVRPESSFKQTSTLTGPQLLDVLQIEERSRSQWLERRALEPDQKQVYVPLGDRSVPYDDYHWVASRTPPSEIANWATGLYMDYAADQYFGSQFLLSAVAVVLVVMLLYFLGRFVNARIGGWMVNEVENKLLGRLPVIRNVYGSVKQVTDFLFSETQVEYRRVVAIEYPRRGIWSLGLVTGDSMLDITAAVGEPCVSVLVPSSPMPVTGYTMCLPRSALLDLDVTVDQAMQFCLSCGVLVPPQQKVTAEILQREMTRRLTERLLDSGTDRRSPAALGIERPSTLVLPDDLPTGNPPPPESTKS